MTSLMLGALALSIATADKPWFMNVVPAYAGEDTAFTVSEMIRQKERAGLDLFLPCLSFHPQTTPAKKLIPELCTRFRTIKAGVAGKGIRVGVLVQSILGHGWNGKVPLTEEKWQHVVLSDGRESPRFCTLDPDFRAYTADAIRSIAREKPEFILIDDDVGIRHGECFCPLHLARLSKALGRAVTREEMQKLYETRPVSDPEVVAANRVLLDSIVEYGRDVIRKSIDEVDPSMRCGLCACWPGYWQLNDLAHALAGGTKPFLRVNCAVYGDAKSLDLVHSFHGQRSVMYQMDPDVELIAESDTFPQNYMSESATMFHAHVTTALLSGMIGAKLWISEFQEPKFTDSQRRYELRLRDYAPFYAKIMEIVRSGIVWQGVCGPTVRPPAGFGGNPKHCTEGVYQDHWNCPIEAVYGIPLRYEGIENGGLVALREEDVKRMTDDEIRKVLAGKALVDSLAARLLTDRGFAPLLGVSASKGGDDFHFQSEWNADRSHSIGHMWNDTCSELKVLDKSAVASWNFCKGRRFENPTPCAPSAVRYVNRLGGRVVTLGWWLDLVYHNMFRPVRKMELVGELDWLNGRPLDFVATSGDQMLVRHGKMSDGSDLVACFSLTYEVLPELLLRHGSLPASVSRLAPDGTWKSVPFRRTAADEIAVGVRVDPLEPILLRFADR